MSDAIIQTDRLVIRRFAATDHADLHEYLSEPVTYLFEPGSPITLEEARDLAVRRSAGQSFLAVVLRANGKMIGHVYLEQTEPKEHRTWELGYIFNPRYQGKGYASEACAAAVGHAFRSYGAHRIMARCNPDNAASWKLLERIGFVREGHFRKYGFIHRDSDGNPLWTDAYEYSRLRGSP